MNDVMCRGIAEFGGLGGPVMGLGTDVSQWGQGAKQGRGEASRS